MIPTSREGGAFDSRRLLRQNQTRTYVEDEYMADTISTEKLMVSLRDGRKLIGVLRSWDQFGMPP